MAKGFKRITGLVVLGLCGLSWVGQTAPQSLVPSHLSILNSQPVKQGSIVRVRAVLSPTDKALSNTGRWTVRLGTQSAKLYPIVEPNSDKASGDWEAILGVSVDTPVGTRQVEMVSPQGDVVEKKPLVIADGQFRKQNISVSKQTAGLQPIPGELEAINGLKNTISEERAWALPLKSPTPDCENSPFGVKRYHNGVYTHDYHKGVDLRSPAGRPIKAIAGGKVVIGTAKFRLHGGTVGLDHGQGLTSIYIHMSKVLVKPGQTVEAGQPIGLVGSTGFASGPHLHWGLYANGIPVNPDFWIPVPHCGKG